ncbi:MAG TPA: hypothetical protein VLX29_03590 [Nitrospirota bacterium]|nr:hypothetical protein [Nitrospirota bacterium]
MSQKDWIKQPEPANKASSIGYTWLEFCLMWISTSAIFMFLLFSNIITAVIVGAFTCWVISLTFMGPWLVHGLHLLGVDVGTAELFKVGAAAGFFAGFVKLKIER